MIRIATVFSGIGAPEEALKQLHINFETVFACDNGERELMQTVKDSNGKALKDENGKIIKEEITYDKIIEQTKGLSNEDLQNYIVRLYNDTKKPNLVKKSYFANNKIKESQWYEDIRFIDGSKYKNKIDLLIGGSPCQSFSTYGKKLGLDDTRGTLFYNYAKLILDAQPKVFIYENVPGLKTHDGGKTWKTIWNVFDNLGYTLYEEELDAQNYGLPQIRKRIFVVGIRGDINSNGYTFPPKEVKSKKKSSDYLDTEIDDKYYMTQKGFEWVTLPEKHAGRSRVNRDIIGCQTANQQFNWTGDFRIEPPKPSHKTSKRIYVGQYDGKESVARKLTPRECLKLMGFKDFKIVVDDYNMYRQSGNSIAVPVIKAIIQDICQYVLK